MQNILVNASGAKVGGALTILNAFCKSKVNDKNFYFILSPIKPDLMPLNSRWIKIETNSIFTLFFATIFSAFYYIHFNCSKLISFSNVNSLFPLRGRVTYFHNLLICKDKRFKYRVIRFVLRFMNQKKARFIFQTNYVKACFESYIFALDDSRICWPGFYLNVQRGNVPLEVHDRKFFLVPITNLNDSHKNFRMVVELATHLVNKSECLFLVTSYREQWNGTVPKNIKFIGNLSHSHFLEKLSISEGVVITSLEETICLPIFESLIFGKPSFVLNKEYLSGLFDLFGEIRGLYVFKDKDEFLSKSILNNNFIVNHVDGIESYSIGDWEFYE